MNASRTTPDPDDRFDPDSIEALLPWYAAGTLSADEKRAVDEALAGDPELRAHLALIGEERDEIVHANEHIAAPSRQLADRVFEAIGRETPAAAARPAAGQQPSWLARFGEWLAGLSPAGLGLAGAAALAVIGLQAGIFGLITLDRATQGTYQTASGERAETPGVFVLVGFQPTATFEAVTQMLDAQGARIVEGPLPGGVFRLRIAAASPGDAERATAALESHPLIRFVAPAPGP
ncbi:anti-sigma factor family protein [Pseudochelatococcus sp. B33]